MIEETENIETVEDLLHFEGLQEETDDYNELPPEDIVAYNELRSCADLLRMYQSGQLEIKPDFQRDIVWSNTMQTRLVDSVVKQLPIPSLCISLDYKTQERFVIDGLQRISSIVKFLDAEVTNEWKLSKLEDIDDRISGKTNVFIKIRYNDLYTKVQNTVLPITVLRCDYSKKSHMNYLFTIFHRLNTGGSKLSNQEIRNCIYNGSFNTFLKKAVTSDIYTSVFDVHPQQIDRFSNEELVLRFIAFTYNVTSYKGQLAKFLNEFMDHNKRATLEKIDEYMDLFTRTMSILYVRILQNNPIQRLSKATTEALFVGIARNINALEQIQEDDELMAKYHDLLEDQLFSLDSLKEGLAQKDKVITRINRAIEIFS
ncbi:DUF262 domain-containing protein [Pedobacter endophyticus]|uniref:DUF262 domain-containing protein n=1 Tax=Pedobacter endophyticus TaxID=2789740 RepID=A0A7S9L1T5_9SPHI|nr:DUF262 domain-containing protein [Pedobacter endophyticus]QPH40669.1 DUF262 domain-containing protein [Pedobacter endophyticus]